MNEQYFAVIYETNGCIALCPGSSKEDCFEKLREVRDDPKRGDRIKATTIIKRDMSNFKDGFIFGNPKSLDVMKEKKEIV